MMYYNGYYPHSFLGSFLGWLIVILVVLWLFNLARGSHYQNWHKWNKFGRDNALDILRERYAKGEINHEEFEKKKKDLEA